jgi:hypothetical protein
MLVAHHEQRLSVRRRNGHADVARACHPPRLAAARVEDEDVRLVVHEAIAFALAQHACRCKPSSRDQRETRRVARTKAHRGEACKRLVCPFLASRQPVVDDDAARLVLEALLT